MTLKEYLTTFWPTSAVLHELLGSLKEAILEEDLESQSHGNLGSKKKAGTGYQEVCCTCRSSLIPMNEMFASTC